MYIEVEPTGYIVVYFCFCIIGGDELLSLKNRLFSMLLLILFAVSLMPSHTLINAATDTAAQQFSLKSASKVLYLGGCSGKTASGKSAKYYSRVKIRNLVDGFDKKNYYINLKSSDDSVVYVDDSKDIVYAAGIGKASVTVTVRKKSGKKRVYKGKLSITVMQNADPDTFIVEGITDGQTVYAGDTLKVTLPGTYTDKRVIECEEEGAVITPLADGKSFEITFEEKGDYLITAATFQSKKYNGFTAYKDFDITVKSRKAEVTQATADSVLLKGELVDEDIEPSRITLYEENTGIMTFHSYASEVIFKSDDEVLISFFDAFNSKKKYRLEYDGVIFDFTSAASEITDTVSFRIDTDTVRANENTSLIFRYYNADGMDITAAVKDVLDREVKPEINAEDSLKAYLNGGYICIADSNIDITVYAELKVPGKNGSEGKTLKTSSGIRSLPPLGTTFTGNMICSLKKRGETYLTVGEKSISEVPLGDSVVFEALFEMDDGSWKNINEAGITGLLVGDQSVVLVQGKSAEGGFDLSLNKTGKTGIVIYKGEDVAGTFEIEVLAKRKPDSIRLDISSDRLNTDPLTDDYVMIKADLLDQYGDIIENVPFSISGIIPQLKENTKAVFHEMAPGRFIIYGYECPADTEQNVINGTVSSSGVYTGFKINICDCPYDPSDSTYEYKLVTDGSLILDNSAGLGKNAPKSTFITVKLYHDGYYMGEGLGYLFGEQPSIRNTPAYYGMQPGERYYGITIEHTSEKGIKTFIGEDDPCVIPSYMDIEFVPYTFGARLETGTYDITVYRMQAGEDRMTDITACDKVSVRVVDTAPEIEVTQKLQSYKGESWGENVTKYFTFTYEGENIGKYITKVDCAESASGSVYIRSVDFLIPNPYFGEYIKTAPVDRLITKQ